MERFPFFNRVRIIVIDGVGCGGPTGRQDLYQDDGANSLVNVSRLAGPLELPTMRSMGLRSVPGLKRIQLRDHSGRVRGVYGAMRPAHVGNGSPEGHQALMGWNNKKPYLYFDKTGFPPEIIEIVEEAASRVMGRRVEALRNPGTDDISGTTIINKEGIGDRHLQSRGGRTPRVITYASTDSVVQLAGHREVISQPQLEEIGIGVRRGLDECGLRVGRVIIRPFEGSSGNFVRIPEGRRDYGVNPDGLTLIDYLSEAGIPVGSVGKAASMLNYRGFDLDRVMKLGDDDARMKLILEQTQDRSWWGMWFDNLVEGDERYGHRRNKEKYAKYLESVDRWLGTLVPFLQEDDLLVLTSDHGNDPTNIKHTNHTDENVFLLIFSPNFRRGANIGQRLSFTDLAATVAENFGLEEVTEGTSFLPAIREAMQI